MILLKNFIRNLYSFFNNHSMILLGILMFSIFIFFKFLRERLPRDIPFNLSVSGFFILLYICCIFGYIVWSYLRSHKKSNNTFTLFIKFIFEPLDAFDNFVKNLPYIKVYYPKVIIWVAHNSIYIFQNPIFEIIFFVIPRSLLIICFIIDIFYFSKLQYIYYILVPCGLILFIRRYFLYSINKLKLEYYNYLRKFIEQVHTGYEFGIHPSEWPENCDPNDADNDEWSEMMALDLDHYIKYYAESKVYKNEEPKIKSYGMTTEFYDTYTNQTKNEFQFYKEQQEFLTIKLKETLKIAIIREYSDKMNNNVSFYVLKIIIYSLYFISWLYILIISFHTLSIPKLIIFINSTWQTYPEPFSDVELFTTLITADSKPGDFTQQQIVQEGIIRNILKKDSQSAPINILLINNSIYDINQRNSGIKLTEIGNAYYEEEQNKSHVIKITEDFYKNSFLSTSASLEKIYIIVPPKVPDNILIENGKAKHLMFGSFDSEGNFHASGYLTSKKSGIKLTDKQYSAFEQEKENKTITNTKTQTYLEYKKPTVIKKDEVRVVKYSDEYLETLDKNILKTLYDIVEQHKEKVTVDYHNTCGITEEQCLNIYKEHDKVAEAIKKNPKTSIKHPQSAEKKKLDKKNKEQQKVNKQECQNEKNEI